ncbi:MAG: diheme cytochrome c precursor [Blastopirellula sp.]|nr:MAG: diheme cytochrome c precursor [Blastopirellula sp.]
MDSQSQPKQLTLLGFLILSLSVVGYFVGLQSPVSSELEERTVDPLLVKHETGADDDVMLATHYAKMNLSGKADQTWMTKLSDLQELPYDPYEKIEVSFDQKKEALLYREKNRAFNGAPPTVPHPVDQFSTASCVACHTEGAKTASLRIPKMPHPFYANCTQCHVEQKSPLLNDELFRENSFVGLPAPEGGPRAFSIAPPQIPHTEWLRNDCLSCHGRTSLPGIRTTHPWRTSCTQCHAASSDSGQTLIDSTPQFLSPIPIKK